MPNIKIRCTKTINTAAWSASVRIAGDLDYETADDLVEVA